MRRRNTDEHGVELAQLKPIPLSQEEKDRAKEILEDVSSSSSNAFHIAPNSFHGILQIIPSLP